MVDWCVISIYAADLHPDVAGTIPVSGAQRTGMLSVMLEYLEFDVSLLEIEPRIWRRFQLESEAHFGDLQMAIQASFEWDGDHMWEFYTKGRNGRTLAGPGAFDLGYVDDEIPDAWSVPACAALQARVDDLPVRLRLRGLLGTCREVAAPSGEQGTVPAPPGGR